MKPEIIEDSCNNHCYDNDEIVKYFDGIIFNKTIQFGSVLYIHSKTISQSKLREAGFIITRDKDKCDFILIEDLLKSGYTCYDYKTKKEQFRIDKSFCFDDLLNNFESQKYQYILSYDLYKTLYKYKGNQELFYQVDELFKSKNSDNVKMAMEFISNANWENNEIYLCEIFNNYYINVIRGNSYKNSISFQGFLNSLDFNYRGLRLHEASDYRKLCISDEHHEWVFNKYKESFNGELNLLITKYKLKVNKLEYSIDKSVIKIGENENIMEEGF